MIYVSVRDLVTNKIVRQYELSDNLIELGVAQFNNITQAKGVEVLWQSGSCLLAVITANNKPFLVQARNKKGTLKLEESSPKGGDNPTF